MMPALALADVLPDFGAGGQPAAPRKPLSDFSIVETNAEQPSGEPPRPAVEDAIREAEAAVEARLSVAHTAAIAEIEARHAAELQQLRSEIGDRAGRLISERLSMLESDLARVMGATVARVIGMALTEDVKRAAVEELGQRIRDAIGDRDAVRVRVTGPASLYEALRAALGQHAERVEFAEAAGFDLSVSIDDRVLETRMADWSAALSEVLA